MVTSSIIKRRSEYLKVRIMDLAPLKTFVTVSETLNITAASDLLYKTQPTITNRISSLERQLGFKLFIRSKGKRDMTLTDKGRSFLAIAKAIIDLYEQIDQIRTNIEQTLTISSIDSVSSTLLPHICNRMLSEAAFNIVIQTHQTNEAYALIASRQSDIAFVSESLSVKGVVVEPAFSQGFYVVKPSTYPGEIQTISPRDLDVKHEIYQNWGPEFSLWHDHWWPASEPPRVRIDATNLLSGFLCNEENWTIMQAGNVECIQTSHQVQLYRLSDSPPARVTYMLTSPYANLDTKNLVDRFRKTVQQSVKHSPLLE